MHIKGHVGIECLKFDHPKHFQELTGTNTVVCEQTNFWALGFKHLKKHMNYKRIPYPYS